MHLHLDPLGGIAGDMFAAALLDAFPDLVAELEASLAETAISRLATIRVESHGDHGLTGSRFQVIGAEEKHPHRSFAEIRTFLDDLECDARVRERSVAMFELLAQAEGSVHGAEPDDVTFHEVGAWDSITDILTAAWLIEALSPAGWSCGPLPLGSGRVQSSHGPLPVPAPATALLLEGFPCLQDGVEGERVTPTGAAILRHIDPDFSALGEFGRLTATGMGFGSRTLNGVSNVLRVLAFEQAGAGAAADRVAVCEFELDDQTPEDLAVALDRLRAQSGVLDILQSPVFGKKGRLGFHVRIIAEPSGLSRVLRNCFSETTTLGVRWYTVSRAVLERDMRSAEADGVRVRVKRARRPDAATTEKAEMDDLAAGDRDRAGREALRRQVEQGSAPDA
ncbi:MAG: LarC family nickel insertion protein [Gemmatimonadota bacterium]